MSTGTQCKAKQIIEDNNSKITICVEKSFETEQISIPQKILELKYHCKHKHLRS